MPVWSDAARQAASAPRRSDPTRAVVRYPSERENTMAGAIRYRAACAAVCATAALTCASAIAPADASAIHTAPPGPAALAVEASAGPVTAFDVNRVETPVTLRVTIAGQNPIVAWTIDVASVVITDYGVVEQLSSEHQPEVAL
ncbi:MAG: hypothetical protein LBK72_10675, partial [Bifidobacteriaceae bacterium]|nr:hypothetical protein [Bifidobacteriaceae bacterium]